MPAVSNLPAVSQQGAIVAAKQTTVSFLRIKPFIFVNNKNIIAYNNKDNLQGEHEPVTIGLKVTDNKSEITLKQNGRKIRDEVFYTNARGSTTDFIQLHFIFQYFFCIGAMVAKNTTPYWIFSKMVPT